MKGRIFLFLLVAIMLIMPNLVFGTESSAVETELQGDTFFLSDTVINSHK